MIFRRIASVKRLRYRQRRWYSNSLELEERKLEKQASMQISGAVISSKGGPFEVRELTLEAPRADEVLVRIVGVGICHTDLVCRDQYFPVPLPCVFGHEGSGVVEAVGAAVTKVAPGDHVVLSYKSCGICANCLAGHAPYCANLYGQNFSGARPDGSSAIHSAGASVAGHFFQQSSFATYAIAHESNTVKVDASAPLKFCRSSCSGRWVAGSKPGPVRS
jgi:aryl-alcohol dehydrogenase